jgi:carbonic anhydrase
MDKINKMLLENKAWAKSKTDRDEKYFSKMAIDQKPEYLWIGCSDSRVPPSEITNTNPGQMFVHRNIANLVVHTDMNFLSVLQYAVHHLKVPHIIVCGHYNCGGVKAALSHQNLGMINNWVRNIKDTYFTYKAEVDGLKSEGDQVNRLVELSVIEQVKNLTHTSIVQEAWKERNYPYIHGWVYDINTGHLKQLVTVSPDKEIDSAYRYDII